MFRCPNIFEVEDMKKFFIILSVTLSALFLLSACGESDSGSNSGTPPPAPVYGISVTPADSLLLKNGEAAKSVTAVVTRDGAPASGVTLTASGSGLSFRPAEGETDEDGLCVFEVSAATDTQTSGVITISGEALSGEAFAAELGYTVVETATLTELWGSEITYLAFTMEGLESDTFTVTTPPERSIRMQESIILNGAVIAVVNEDGDLEFSYDKGFLLGSGSDSYIEHIRVIVDGGEPSLLAVRINVANGSREYPYPIRTKKELQAINYNVKGVYPNLNKHFILMNNISMDEDDEPWTPIGVYSNTASARPFSGSFNGNNHSITDLTGSLFLYIKPDVPDPDNPPVVVEKLHLETPPGGMDIAAANNTFTGILASYVYGGVIQYVSAGGKVTSTDNGGGIFIGRFMDGAILRRCYSTVDATNMRYNTGLLVQELGAQIEDCYTTGSVAFYNAGSTMAISGIASTVGSTYLIGKVYNTYATGKVGGPSLNQGGHGGGIFAATQTCAGCEVKNNIALIDYIRIGVNNPEGVGRISSPATVTLENNYAYKDMVIIPQTGSKTVVSDLAGVDGLDIEPTDLTADFFIRDAASSGLGWSGEIWDFDFDDTERSWKLPIIKGYREAEQKLLCLPAHLQTDPGYTTDFPHCL
jgi:hypothetical protein